MQATAATTAGAAASDRAEPIPGTLNIALAFGACGIAMGLLWIASHASSWITKIAAAVVFSYVNNTIFSLLHEAVHGIFHTRRRINDAFGRVLAAFFPTAYRFQQVCHLGHHRRNRTEAELFDYYRPGDNKLMKWVQWYGILTGIYWIVSPLGCLLYLACPWVFRLRPFRARDSKLAQQTSLDAMLSGFDVTDGVRIRLEILLSLAIQFAIVAGLGLTWSGWLLCYAAFAFNWSSLQYADHAWSELDVEDGAWNLRVSRGVQWIFLNYHHHRAHHRNPGVPWLHLSRRVDPAEPRPSFLAIYLKMWLGPRPLPESLRPATRRGGE